jgi:hypothetical protein
MTKRYLILANSFQSEHYHIFFTASSSAICLDFTQGV